MKIRNSIFALAFVTVGAVSIVSVTPSFAQTAPAAVNAEVQNQTFFKKKYKIKGSWSLINRNGKTFISFSDDFKTKNGPDLKVFLSPESVENVNGKNAVGGSINLGVLKKNKGAQEYEIPDGTDLSKFSTVLVHCEAYSILWGGGAL